MDFTLTINVSVEHVDDTPHVAKNELLEMIAESIHTPQVFTAETGAKYTVEIWEVEEA